MLSSSKQEMVMTTAQHVNLTHWLNAIGRQMRAEADGPRKDLLKAMYVEVVRRLPEGKK
jgi:hypothetical protein